jgi:hypothetical protein
MSVVRREPTWSRVIKCSGIIWSLATLVAASRAADVPAPPGLGQLLIQDAQSDSPVRLDVARYHVHVVLQPPVALVQIDQSFYNPFGRQQEGQFLFNLPAGASVSRFAMYVSPTELIEGELVERQRAAEIYRSIVTRRRDPAILEQLGDNLFKMRVFPIFARDEKRILLDFTLPLEPQAGRYQFRLPLLSDRKPIWDFRLSGVIRGAVAPASAACASHPDMPFEPRPDGGVEFQWHEHNVRPETDLVLTFAERADRPATLRSFVAGPLPTPTGAQDKRPPEDASRRTATYFLAEIPPLADVAEPATTAPADVLVLADTSSSIGDLAAVRRTVREIAQSLRPQDRLRVWCIDVAPRPLHEGWLKPAATASALEQLDREFCLGKSDLDACLRAAVDEFGGQAGRRRRLAIYVGDGAGGEAAGDALQASDPASPRVAPAGLRDSGVVLVAVGVQRADATTDYLRSLVDAAGGLWFDLAGDVRASGALARWLRGGLPSPQRIADVAVEGARGVDLFWPGAWLPGEPLYVYGRMPETSEVKLRLTLACGRQASTREWNFPVLRRDDDVFVGRLWAQRQLDRLRRQGEASEEVRQAIVALSQEWSLLSPHTAFLVLESEADYPRWGLDRRVRRRYWKPAEARPEAPLPAQWVEQFQQQQAAEAWEDEVAKAIEAARRAMAAGQYAEARRLLLAVKEMPQSTRGRPAVGACGAQQQPAVGACGLQQCSGLLDPARAASTAWQARVTTLLGSAFRADPDFLRRHPYAEQLLQEVEWSSFAQGLTLEQFASQLAALTGTNVCLDRRALDDIGIRVDLHLTPSEQRSVATGGASADDPFADPDADRQQRAQRSAWPGAGRISLRGGTRLLLRQLDLVCVEEPHRLLITTPEEAEMRLATEVYPIADLLFTDRSTPPWLLAHPYLERQQHVRQRLESKLQQPITIECRARPLADVVLDLASILNDTVLIDQQALNDSGIDHQAPITASFRDMPARQALEWLLRDLDLDYTLHEEALIVTTPEAAESWLEVRLHSARGVLYEYPAAPRGFSWGWGVIPDWNVGGATMRGFSGGWGGGLGGMAGFGSGMAGGSFGGGMAGFGGGTFGGSPSGPGVRGTAGLSSGGEAEAEPRESSPFAAAGGVSATPAAANSRAAAALDPPWEESYSHDSDTLVELITSTIAPQTWDLVGGPGSIAFFPYSLDLAFAQTREVHQQVAELLDRLRRLPPQVPAATGGRPATIPPSRLEAATGPDFDTLIDVITTTVRAETWDDVGGPGSIAAEPTRMALVVSQTAEVQDELAQLLTMLRRGRYETLHGSRPWEAGGAGLRPAAAEIFGEEARESLRWSDYPAAERAELEALLVRCEPGEGRWQWRRVTPSGAREAIVIRRGGQRLECELPTCVVRTEGDVAAVAWRDLRLAELGNYAELLRRTIDAGLPWLPHRSNEELARLFEVSAVRDGNATETSVSGDATWLRLMPTGLPREGGSYLQIAYSPAHGAPLVWESYGDGQRTARIRFSGHSPNDPQRATWTAVLEDAQGQERARWELVEYQAQPGELPPPDEPFAGYVHLDRRAPRPALDAPLAEALTALRAFDWAGAGDQLRRLPDDRARHPLVLLLQAWCLENDRRPGNRDRLVTQLLEVAQSGLPELLRFVTAANFPSLTAAQRYAILALQDEGTRTAEDNDRLAEAAIAAGRETEALAHVEAALAQHAPEADVFARQRRRIELLLRLSRAEEAVSAAQRWARAADRRPHDLASLAELLAAHAQLRPADELFERAAQPRTLAAEERYALLRRWAAVRQGAARCEKLLEAAALQPADSPARRECVDLLRRELATAAEAETAGQLAANTADASLAAELIFRQAELTPDVRLAAALLWELAESERLGDARLAYACQTWNRAGQPGWVIRVGEAALRGGQRLPPTVTAELAVAYRAEGREAEARRAASRDAEPVPGADAGAERHTPNDRPRMGGGFF